jgi:hypothetical protein
LFSVLLGNEPGHRPIADTVVMLLLKAADCIQDLRVGRRIRLLKMVVIALPGYICNTA